METESDNFKPGLDRFGAARTGRRRTTFIGLDLTDARRTSNRADLADLFEERPRGSGTYLLRDEVVAARHPEFWEEGVIYYVPAKKQFYIVEEPGHPGSGSKTFYGPFAGEPWKRFGMAEPRPVEKRHRLAIYLVVDPVVVAHQFGDDRPDEGVALEQLRLAPVPLFTQEDIVEYDWDEHFLKLTPEAWKRLPAVRSWGLPFVIVADGDLCYLGTFSSVGSSYMLKVPFIGGFRPGWRENKVQISPPDSLAGARDPRNDPRIRKVLEELKIVGATKERLKSADKLKGLGRALLTFANDHQGNYPDALQELAQKDYIDEQDLKWFLENVQYHVEGKTAADPPNATIAYDKTLLDRANGTNVLFNDSHVAFARPEQLEKLGITRSFNKGNTPAARNRTAGDVSRQLEQVVDLSVLRPDMTFAEALGHLKNSVEPPLVIVVLWRDVEDNADVHRITPINMDPISAVQLGAALELLLRSVSGREAELDYVVNDGVIVIATKESLRRKMETRVYDISALIGVRSKGGYRRQYYGTGQSYGGGSLGDMPGEYVHLPGGWGAMRRSDFNKLSNVRRPGSDSSPPPVPFARLFDERANEIRQRVIEITGPGSWAGEGGSGSIYVHENTKLIIRQTAENHQKIQMLLNEMRKAAGALVEIESRLIFLPPDYSGLQRLFKEEKLQFEPTVDDPNVSYCLLDSAQAGRLLKLAQGGVGSMVLTAPRLTQLSGESATLSFGGATADVHRPGELPADMPSRYVSLTFTPSVKQDSGDISLALTVAFDKVVGHKNYVIETPLPGGAVAEQKQELPQTKEIWRLRTYQRVPEGKTLLVSRKKMRIEGKDERIKEKDCLILIGVEKVQQEQTDAEALERLEGGGYGGHRKVGPETMGFTRGGSGYRGSGRYRVAVPDRRRDPNNLGTGRSRMGRFRTK